MASTFERESAVFARGNGSFDAMISGAWSVGAGPNGGFTAALLLRAAIEHLGDPDMFPRSFTAHLMGAPRTGACELMVLTTKHGRTAAFLTVRLVQDDAVHATASVVCVRSRPDHERYQQRTMPSVRSAAELGTATEVRREVPGYVARYDQRFATPPLRGDGRPSVVGWTRFVDPTPFDAVAIAAIADSFPPPSLACTTQLLGALTLDYTVHFRAALPTVAAPTGGYVLAEFESNFAQEGFAEEDGWIWAPDGTLLAQARQLGLLRALPEAAHP